MDCDIDDSTQPLIQLLILFLQISYGSQLGNRGPTFDMDLSEFMDGDRPISYDKALAYFNRDTSQK